MSIQSLRALSQVLMWVSIIMPVIGALAAGARFYVDRQERKLSAAMAQQQLDGVKNDLAERTKELGRVQRQVAVVRTVELNLDLSGVKMANVMNAVHSELPVRKTIALAGAGFAAPVQFECSDGAQLSDSESVRHIRAIYTPVKSAEIIGRDVQELTNLSEMALDLSEILEVANLDLDKPAELSVAMSVNGVPVVTFADSVNLQTLSRGEYHVDVAAQFSRAASKYDAFADARRSPN